MANFVIVAVVDENEKYFSIDRSSGGYPYWGSLRDAEFFTSESDADKVLRDDKESFHTRMKWCDGSSGPPRMIRSALELNRAKKKGTGKIFIREITFRDVRSLDIEGEDIR